MVSHAVHHQGGHGVGGGGGNAAAPAPGGHQHHQQHQHPPSAAPAPATTQHHPHPQDVGGGVVASSNGAHADPHPPIPEHSSDVNVELERVAHALSSMFSPSSNHHTPSPHPGGVNAEEDVLRRRDQADRYLTSFQRLPVAWMVCDRMLQPDPSPTAGSGVAGGGGGGGDEMALQRRFFAAQTLHSKCRDEIHQLPPSSLPSLRDSLVGHFVHYDGLPGTPRALRTRLALAVSALAVQMCWTSVVDDMLARRLAGIASATATATTTTVVGGAAGGGAGARASAQAEADERFTCLVLDLFHLLPEEAWSGRMFVPDEHTLYEYRESLRRSAPSVLRFLSETLNRCGGGGVAGAAGGDVAAVTTPSQSSVGIMERVYSTYQTWIKYVDIPPNVVSSQSDLITSTFSRGLEMDELFELCVDVVVELLRAYPSDYRENEVLVWGIIPQVMRLRDGGGDGTPAATPTSGAHTTTVAASAAGTTTPTTDITSGHSLKRAMGECDEDRVRGYCRIFTEMGESYMSLIMASDDLNEVAPLVELVLTCSAVPDHEIAGIALNFWYRFVHALESLEPHNYRQTRVDHYQPLLRRLIHVCVSLLRYPPDYETLLADQKEDADRNRSYVCDTVEDCCRLLGGMEVLKSLGELLQQECQQFTSAVQEQHKPPGQVYQGMEACLLAIRSIARFVPNDEALVLPFIFGQVLPQLPADLPRLRHTVNLCIGSYSSWLGKHPQHLQPLLPYLAQGFAVSRECSSASATAIRHLCEHCDDPPMAEPVLELYEQLMAQQQHHHHQQQAHQVPLELKDELEILEGICKALSRQAAGGTSTTVDTSQVLGRLVQPIGTRLAAVTPGEQQPRQGSASRHVIAETERLTVIVRSLGSPKSGSSPSEDFIVELMRQSWLILEALTKQHPNDINLAEKVCRLHKHAMRSCGPESYAPLLDPLMTQLVTNFRQSYLSPYLYAASICITEFGRDPIYVPQLFEMISQLSATVFSRLTSFDDFTCHPDVVEEFFYLIGRFMSYCPEPLVISPLFPSILQCAGVGMHVAHREANKGTLNFLESTVSFGLQLDQTSEASASCRIALQSAIESEFQAVVDNLANALLGELPAYCLDRGSGSIAGLLWKLNSLCPALLHQWIAASLLQAPEPAKSDFMGALNGTMDRDEFYATVRQFRNLCERERKLRSTPNMGTTRRSR